MLDRTSAKPLHAQMEEIIRHNLATNTWKPNMAIPSENELSKKYGISRMTVRNVTSKLVQENLLERIPGKGTFVKEYKITTTGMTYIGIRDQLEKMGYAVTTKIVSMEKKSVDKSIYTLFNLSEDDVFYELYRLRFLKDVPLSLHISYMPTKLYPELEKKDLVNQQLCVILCQHYGIIRENVVETLESVAATKQVSELLQVRKGYPLLQLEDTNYSDKGQVFEYSKVIFRGDKIKIKLEF